LRAGRLRGWPVAGLADCGAGRLRGWPIAGLAEYGQLICGITGGFG
jgi:hypothetical protein